MANHGYVFTNQSLTKEQLKEDIQDINNEFLGGLFEIEDLYNDGFYIINKKYFNFGIQLWISDEVEYGSYTKIGDASTYIEHNEPKILSKNSVIEFRHGHGSEIFWWLEGLFRENLAKKYNGLVGDDGYEEREKERADEYATFDKFLDIGSGFFRRQWNIFKNEHALSSKYTNQQIIDNLKADIQKTKREEKLKRIT